MNPRYAQVALRAGHRCDYCHAPEAAFNFPFEIEHIVPISAGGDDAAANWALACRACNLYKATHVNGSDPESHAVSVKVCYTSTVPTIFGYVSGSRGPYLWHQAGCSS